MGKINKGTIASISGNTARVVPAGANPKATAMLSIIWYLRGEAGDLKKGTEVIYVEFEDSTGVILSRADGEGGFNIDDPSGGEGEGLLKASFTMAVDDNGDLYVQPTSDGALPEFEYDKESGNLYVYPYEDGTVPEFEYDEESGNLYLVKK